MKKNNYEIYLLDADGTLLDFDQAEKISFASMLADMGLPFNDELFASYHLINRGLWQDMAGGKISKDELLLKRFEILTKQTGLYLKPDLANLSFLTHLSYQALVYPGIEETLKKLSTRGKIAIATNGVDFVQKRRFALSGLMPYIADIFVSEAIGAAKPEPLFFEAALSMLGNPDPDTVLMVGDSPESDIRGAVAFGLASCLYDPKNIHPLSEAQYTIRDLSELLEL